MFIPNCEKETFKGLYGRGEVTNDYYQGFLSEEDAQKVIAYDFIKDYAGDFDFRNAELYCERDLTEAEYIALKKLEILTMEHPEINDIISMSICGAINDLKNDEVMSLIENYNDEEYEKNRKAYEDGFRNCLVRKKGGIKND